METRGNSKNLKRMRYRVSHLGPEKYRDCEFVRVGLRTKTRKLSPAEIERLQTHVLETQVHRINGTEPVRKITL